MGRSPSRDRIQRLIDERQQYRRDRDFGKADRLRDELRDMGVQVDDAASTWTGPGGLEGRYGGRPGGGGGFGGGGGGGGYGGGGGADRDRIQRLVDERQSYRRDRDFNTADRMRDELRDMGVQVSDDSLTWRGPGGMEGTVNNGGGGGGRGRGRSRSRSPGRYGGGPPGGGYGMPGFGMPPPGYGGPPPGYGMPPTGMYGMPPGGGYGMPPPGYGGPPPLPPGWEQVTDPASGRPYFCNRSTGETSWTPPPAPAGGPGGPGGGPGGPGGYGGGPGPGGPGGSPPLPQGWEQANDPASGKPYYFNRASGETRWEPP